MPYSDINDKVGYNRVWYIAHRKEHITNMKEYYIQNKTRILKRMKQAYKNKK